MDMSSMMGRPGHLVLTTAPLAPARLDILPTVHLGLSPPVLSVLACFLSESRRQVRCSVHLIRVPLCIVCIRWPILESAVLDVEVNKLLNITVTWRNGFTCRVTVRLRLCVWRRGASRGQQLVCRLHSLHVLHVCGWGDHLLWSTLSISLYQLH